MTRLLVAADPAGAARLAAEVVAGLVQGAIAARGRCVLSLAGGSTPRRLHAWLAGPLAGRVDWARVHLLLGDERCVPPDHPDSNFRMVRETLLDRVPVPARQVHRWQAEDPDPERAAAAYQGVVQGLFPAMPPRLDLALLGLGPDGHVASLFPGTPALEEGTRLAVSPWVEPLGARRLTLTFPVLAAARAVLVLASGRDKAGPAAAACAGPGPLPVQRLSALRGGLSLVLDAAAARDLRAQTPAETGPAGGKVV